jgi:transcriptional regulator with XRE-family HTH domain
MNKTLGARIRELRDAKDFSLRELSKEVGGLSAAFLSDIELGRRFPSEKVLGDLAKALGTDVEDLKKYDPRAPVEDMRRLAEKNPAYGFAFRQIVDKKISPEALLNMIGKQKKK